MLGSHWDQQQANQPRQWKKSFWIWLLQRLVSMFPLAKTYSLNGRIGVSPPRYKCNGRWDSRKPCASLVRFCWGDTKRTGDPNNGLYTWWYCNHKSSWNLEGGFDVWKYWKKEIFRNCLALQDNVNSSILNKRWAHRSCQGNRFDYHRPCCHKICWQFPITSY